MEIPVVGAPLAGGSSTPELTAAVSDAGGLGFIAAGYKTVDEVRREIEHPHHAEEHLAVGEVGLAWAGARKPVLPQRPE